MENFQRKKSIVDKDVTRNVNIDEKILTSVNQKIDLSDIIKYQSLSINGILINNPKTVKSNNNPKISIVISVYNGEGFLVPAVRSIQNQNFKDFEIIIVDDRSEDIVESF